MADLLHSALDLLPSASAGGSYHLSVVWLLKDALPDESATPKAIFGVLSRAHHWHGATVLAVPVKPYQNPNRINHLLDSVRAESLVAGDIECLSEFINPNVFWRGKHAGRIQRSQQLIHRFHLFLGNLAFIDPKTYLPKPLQGFELYCKNEADLDEVLCGLSGVPLISPGPSSHNGNSSKRTSPRAGQRQHRTRFSK